MPRFTPPFRDQLQAVLAVRYQIAQHLGFHGADWVSALDDGVQALANEAGHGDANRIEAEIITPLEESLGRDVAYHPVFAKAFPVYVALLPLATLEEDLAHHCRQLHLSTAQDYQYLLDLLDDALLPDVLPPALAYAWGAVPEDYPDARRRQQRLNRAATWLSREREQAPLTVLPLTPPANPPTAPTDPWAGVLAGGCSAARLVRVLQRAGLLADDGRTPTAEAKPGAWVGAVTALREKGLLTRRNHAAVARALHQAFGDVVSERQLQRGYQPDNELHSRFYSRTLAFSGS